MAMCAIEIFWIVLGIASGSFSPPILGTAVTVPVSNGPQTPTLAKRTARVEPGFEDILKDQHPETSIDESERLTLPNHGDSGATSPQGASNTSSLLLHLNSHGLDQLTISWTMDTNATDVTNFVATYKTSKGEHYDSNPLGKQVREYTFTSMDKDEEYMVCIHAMINGTSVQEVCSVWSESSMKVIVGILAGVVGLIPCFVALLWVMRKDKKMVAYMVLESSDLQKEGKEGQTLIKDKTNQGLVCMMAGGSRKDPKVSPSQVRSHIHEGYDNDCFSLEHDGEHQSCNTRRQQSTEDHPEEREINRQESSNFHQRQDQSQQHSGVTLTVANLATETVICDGKFNPASKSEPTTRVTVKCPPQEVDAGTKHNHGLGQCSGQVMISSTLETFDPPSYVIQNGNSESDNQAYTITHF